MTSDLYLGLDISTSCTGWSLIDSSGNFYNMGWFDLSDCKNFYEKADAIENGLRELPVPKGIFVEEHVLGFRSGMSSAGVIVTLAKFNAVVCQICWKLWGIQPVSIMVKTARSKVGLKVPKGENAKVHVVAWARTRTPDSAWKTRIVQVGKRKGQTELVHGSEDAADAFLLVTAGLKTL